MQYSKKEIKKGINLHLINTEKFKTNLIAIFLSTPLSRDTITFNSVLTSVLRRGCKQIQTQEEISKKLEEMYGAEFDCGVDKIGKNNVLKFYLESINDEFLPQKNENMIEKSINILSQIIFNPLIEEEKFNEEYINQEKENMKQIIEAKKDNKARYALFRCMEEMYKEEPEGLYKFGYAEDIEKITPESLYSHYKKLIKECKIDIFVSGELNNIDIEKIILDNDTIKNQEDRNPNYIINEIEEKQKVEQENSVQESMDVTQGKLVIGYDIVIDSKDKENENLKYIGMLYNGILGGSANSKLFQNVREKASLAYTASSSYSHYSGNIFVNAGIEIGNYEKALEIIKEQVQEMKERHTTEEEIDNIKQGIISGITSIDDEQDTEIIYFLGQELGKTKVDLEEYTKKIKDISKDQILDLAQKVNINTIYFLKN